MTPLQYFRWRIATRRAAKGTIALVERNGGVPESLVDVGARNSEFMGYLAAHWRNAQVDSFEMNPRCHPLAAFHAVRLSDKPGSRLSDWVFREPSLLKIDVDCAVNAVLNGIDFAPFRWVVQEVIEDGINGFGIPSNRSQLNRIMEEAGFDRSAVVDATVCLLSDRIMQTDVLYWRSDKLRCPGCPLAPLPNAADARPSKPSTEKRNICKPEENIQRQW